MLALLALEATTHALQYEGLSTIYASDSALVSKLDNRQVKWGSVKDPATRVLRKVYRMAAGRIKYKHHETVDRMAPDPDKDAIHQGVWLAGQVAAGRPLSELSDIVYVNDHAAPSPPLCLTSCCKRGMGKHGRGLTLKLEHWRCSQVRRRWIRSAWKKHLPGGKRPVMRRATLPGGTSRQPDMRPMHGS